MPQVISTNSMSLLARNNLNKSQGALNTAIERLSSGKRINSAKDDAAGQAIANRFTANIRGLTQAARNANDGISIAQTAEGALNEINSNVHRIRELSVKALNGTNSMDDKLAIQKEINQRLEEITRISQQTDFNGTKLMVGAKDASGSATANPLELSIQVGANDGETIIIKLDKIDTTALGINAFAVMDTKVPEVDANGQTVVVEGKPTMKDVPATADPLQALDDALAKIDAARSQVGAAQNRFESAIANIQNTETNLTAACSRIQDADYSEEVSSMTLNQILQQAGMSILAQANQAPQQVLQLLK